jgi:hypothetical protein
MGTRPNGLLAPGLGWAAPSAAAESWAAEVVEDAATEPPNEPRASERAASSYAGVRGWHAFRRVLCALLTSSAARLAYALELVVGAQPSIHLRVHLDKISRRSAPVAGTHNRRT